MKSIKRYPSKRNSNSGFTMVEILVVLTILGVIAGLIVPNLLQGRAVAIEGVASETQSRLTDVYNQWTHAGGTHSTSASHDLTVLMVQTLTGVPSQGGVKTTNGGAYIDETLYMVGSMSPAGAVRITLPALMTIDPANGGKVMYDKRYEISFAPSGANRGMWTVMNRDPSRN